MRIESCTHAVQLYGDEASLMRRLTAYVASALESGAGSVVIATEPHTVRLLEALGASGVDVCGACEAGQLVLEDAGAALDRFMTDGWPDARLFRQTLLPLIERARGDGRPVAAFGEMVVLLWRQRAYAATLELERMWTRVCDEQGIELLCAYPRDCFPREGRETIAEVSAAHTRVFAD
jgi:hypothetical protein